MREATIAQPCLVAGAAMDGLPPKIEENDDAENAGTTGAEARHSWRYAPFASNERHASPLRRSAAVVVLLLKIERFTRAEHARDLRNVPPMSRVFGRSYRRPKRNAIQLVARRPSSRKVLNRKSARRALRRQERTNAIVTHRVIAGEHSSDVARSWGRHAGVTSPACASTAMPMPRTTPRACKPIESLGSDKGWPWFCTATMSCRGRRGGAHLGAVELRVFAARAAPRTRTRSRHREAEAIGRAVSPALVAHCTLQQTPRRPRRTT